MLNMDKVFGSILESKITPEVFAICAIASIILGFFIAISFSFKNKSSGNFAIAIALLPVMVQVVIMMVNGNLGTGVAVMGAFSLVRFRSAPGNAKEIVCVFLAMAVGLATGTGFVGIAVIITVIVCVLNFIYSLFNFCGMNSKVKELKITIPESLDYTSVFDEIFSEYTSSAELFKVKTTNMGSLYQLFYYIVLKNPADEMKFIDAIRCRNGNLDIVCGRVVTSKDEL